MRRVRHRPARDGIGAGRRRSGDRRRVSSRGTWRRSAGRSWPPACGSGATRSTSSRVDPGSRRRSCSSRSAAVGPRQASVRRRSRSTRPRSRASTAAAFGARAGGVAAGRVAPCRRCAGASTSSRSSAGRLAAGRTSRPSRSGTFEAWRRTERSDARRTRSVRPVLVLDSRGPPGHERGMRPCITHARRSPRGCRTAGVSASRTVRGPRGTRRSTEPGGPRPHAVRLDAPAAGGRRPLRPPDAPLEPQDAPVHLRGAQRDPHHRPRPDRQPPRRRARRSSPTPSPAATTILFVGTKKQAQEPVAEEATRAEMPYVNQRWLGGMLTNFVTIRKRLGLLDQLEARQANGDFERLSKKEASRLTEEMTRLQRTLGGIRKMRRLPGALFVVDPQRERIAVTEARKLEIPVIGDRRHERRPRPARLHHPGQRRRDPRHPAAVPARRRRRHRGRSASERRAPRPSRRWSGEVSEAEEASDEMVAALAAGGTFSFEPEPDEDEDAPARAGPGDRGARRRARARAGGRARRRRGRRRPTLTGATPDTDETHERRERKGRPRRWSTPTIKPETGQGAPRAHRRRDHGLQARARGDRRRPRGGHRAAAREGPGRGRQQGRPRRPRGPGRPRTSTPAAASACSSRSTARPTSWRARRLPEARPRARDAGRRPRAEYTTIESIPAEVARGASAPSSRPTRRSQRSRRTSARRSSRASCASGTRRSCSTSSPSATPTRRSAS